MLHLLQIHFVNFWQAKCKQCNSDQKQTITFNFLFPCPNCLKLSCPFALPMNVHSGSSLYTCMLIKLRHVNFSEGCIADFSTPGYALNKACLQTCSCVGSSLHVQGLSCLFKVEALQCSSCRCCGAVFSFSSVCRIAVCSCCFSRSFMFL